MVSRTTDIQLWGKVVHPARSFPTTRRVVCGLSRRYGVRGAAHGLDKLVRRVALGRRHVLLHAEEGDLLPVSRLTVGTRYRHMPFTSRQFAEFFLMSCTY